MEINSLNKLLREIIKTTQRLLQKQLQVSMEAVFRKLHMHTQKQNKRIVQTNKICHEKKQKTKSKLMLEVTMTGNDEEQP